MPEFRCQSSFPATRYLQYICIVGCFDHKVFVLVASHAYAAEEAMVRLVPPWTNGEALEKQTNVLLDKECIIVSSQEDNEQSMMNMKHKLSELENEVREKLHDLIFMFSVAYDYDN